MEKKTIRKQFSLFTNIELLEEIAEHSIERTSHQGDDIIKKMNIKIHTFRIFWFNQGLISR
jgi:hypothetical protein